jgi:phosphoribosyl 1,2-cyclic phosphate phosphodiesterase
MVIDTGPDFRMQALTNKIEKLDCALLTHFHKDHIAGLDDVKPFSWSSHKPFDIYANKDTLNAVTSEFSYAFRQLHYPGLPEFQLHELNDKEFLIHHTSITPVPVLHHRLSILGFRIANFAYITDASYIPDSSMLLLKNLDVLVLNGLRETPHIAHFSLSEALQVIEQLAPKTAYITHISHDLGKHEVISKKLPKNVFLAFDGLTVEI